MPETPKVTALSSKQDKSGYEPARSLDGFEAKTTDWLWWPWIPLNKLSIIEGEPDVGKSTITLDIASRTSKGRFFPQTTISDEYDSRTVDKCALINKPSGVLIVGIEDGIEDTVVPRLAAAGADLSKIYTTGIERDKKGIPIPLTIPEGVERLEQDIRTANAKLVIIDPITAFFSDKVKPGDDTSNRKALNYLVDLAERLQCAILLVRHHNKSAGQSAKNRGTGSTAIGALVRSVFTAGHIEKEDGTSQFVLARVKCNLAPRQDSLSYNLGAHPANSEVPIVTWGRPVSISADELVQSENAPKHKNTKEQQCKDMIVDLLTPGPQLAEYILNFVSQEVGTSTKTVRRAADKLNINSEQLRNAKGAVTSWRWSMSPSGRQESPSKGGVDHSSTA